MRFALLAAVAILPFGGGRASASSVPTFDPAEARARIEAVMNSAYPRLDAIYKDLHQHPELPFQEKRTAGILASNMRKLGFDVTERVGGTGVVAVYRNGPGPVVLVRTDMDALPMEEQTGLPYASQARQLVDGKQSPVAHACGHDAHMTWWLGTAETLIAMRAMWRGTLVFLGQPAEETLSGAKAVLADGLFARFPKPDYAFAAHVGGGMPVGALVVKDGAVLSAADAIDVTFNGRGAHGSSPSSAIDPVMMGANFVTDVQTVISRRKDAQEFGVITVGAFQAGTVGNVIPSKAELKLSLRSFTPEVRRLLIEGVETTARAVSDMAGAPAPTITHRHGVAATRNDSALVAQLGPVLRSVFGDGLVVIPASSPGFSGSEDFAEFGAAGVPSVYFMVGGDDPKRLASYKAQGIPMPTNHSPDFAPVPEPTIRNGVSVLTLAVLTVAINWPGAGK